MRFTLLLALFPLLCSCASPTVATRPKPEDYPPAIISSAGQCISLGGTWRRAGMRGEEICDVPTKDAGRDCRDSSECLSACVAPEKAHSGQRVVGKCYGSFLTLGTCLARVSGGVAQVPHCSD